MCAAEFQLRARIRLYVSEFVKLVNHFHSSLVPRRLVVLSFLVFALPFLFFRSSFSSNTLRLIVQYLERSSHILRKSVPFRQIDAEPDSAMRRSLRGSRFVPRHRRRQDNKTLKWTLSLSPFAARPLRRLHFDSGDVLWTPSEGLLRIGLGLNFLVTRM